MVSPRIVRFGKARRDRGLAHLPHDSRHVVWIAPQSGLWSTRTWRQRFELPRIAREGIADPHPDIVAGHFQDNLAMAADRP